MRSLLRLSLSVALLLAAAGPTVASFHVIKIAEVFAGTPAAPNAQFVELQMWTDGQNQLTGTKVRVYDGAGAEIMAFMFPGVVPIDSDQSSVLIATAEAQAFFNVTPNLLM